MPRFRLYPKTLKKCGRWEDGRLNDVLGSLFVILGVADWHVLHMQVETWFFLVGYNVQDMTLLFFVMHEHSYIQLSATKTIENIVIRLFSCASPR